MKKIAFYLLSLIFIISCKQTPSKVKEIPLAKTQKKAFNLTDLKKNELKITGMVCAIGCAAVIEKKLNATLGIQSAKVLFEEGVAQIIFDPNQIKEEELTRVIKSVGDAYDVVENIQVENFKLLYTE